VPDHVPAIDDVGCPLSDQLFRPPQNLQILRFISTEHVGTERVNAFAQVPGAKTKEVAGSRHGFDLSQVERPERLKIMPIGRADVDCN
jgi:hypothetical protein